MLSKIAGVDFSTTLRGGTEVDRSHRFAQRLAVLASCQVPASVSVKSPRLSSPPVPASVPRVAPRQIRVNCDSAAQATPPVNCGNASKQRWRWGNRTRIPPLIVSKVSIGVLRGFLPC